MRLSVIFCVICAIAVHAGFLLFGGAIFAAAKPNHGTTQEVELLTEAEEEKEEEKPEEIPEEQPEELETEEEQAPDATEIVRNMEMPPTDDAPALDAASLSAIEAALNGQTGSGEFGAAMSFESGGRIGGTGKAGSLDDQLNDAFSLAEIDQRPRATFQTTPAYPSQMRGKKQEGVVTIIFIVDAAGKVANARVDKSTHAAFEKPALDAVKKWKFEPGVKAGQRVASKMRIDIRFPAS